MIDEDDRDLDIGDAGVTTVTDEERQVDEEETCFKDEAAAVARGRTGKVHPSLLQISTMMASHSP